MNYTHFMNTSSIVVTDAPKLIIPRLTLFCSRKLNRSFKTNVTIKTNPVSVLILLEQQALIHVDFNHDNIKKEISRHLKT